MKRLLATFRTNFDMVSDMYEKFGFVSEERSMASIPHLIDKETTAFRIQCLKEEIIELEKGYAADDLLAVADALVDLVVFALGTARLHNLPWEILFLDVQRANMSKVVGTKPSRGFKVDLVKPADWQGPKTKEILKLFGWVEGENKTWEWLKDDEKTQNNP